MNKRETELVKTVVKKRGGAAALRGQGSTNLTPGDASTECHTPRGRGDGWMDVSARSSPPLMAPDDRAMSPISTASSSSEPPLAQKFQKVNGSNNDNSTPAPPPPGSTNANAGSTRNSVRPSDIERSSLSSSPARPVSVSSYLFLIIFILKSHLV
jgi:SWI/SNF-related matrix-associated actin-dependent regulator of chromatin subfamily B protein 1